MNGAFSLPLTGIQFGNKEAFPTQLCTEANRQGLKVAAICSPAPALRGCRRVAIPL